MFQIRHLRLIWTRTFDTFNVPPQVRVSMCLDNQLSNIEPLENFSNIIVLRLILK